MELQATGWEGHPGGFAAGGEVISVVGVEVGGFTVWTTTQACEELEGSLGLRGLGPGVQGSLSMPGVMLASSRMPSLRSVVKLWLSCTWLGQPPGLLPLPLLLLL